MEWTAEYMTFYVDGEKLLTYHNDGSGKEAWPFDAAFYPILNLAWGGAWGGGQGVDPISAYLPPWRWMTFAYSRSNFPLHLIKELRS